MKSLGNFKPKKKKKPKLNHLRLEADIFGSIAQSHIIFKALYLKTYSKEVAVLLGPLWKRYLPTNRTYYFSPFLNLKTRLQLQL